MVTGRKAYHTGRKCLNKNKTQHKGTTIFSRTNSLTSGRRLRTNNERFSVGEVVLRKRGLDRSGRLPRQQEDDCRKKSDRHSHELWQDGRGWTSIFTNQPSKFTLRVRLTLGLTSQKSVFRRRARVCETWRSKRPRDTLGFAAKIRMRLGALPVSDAK